jgi:hypothetical protein
MTTLKTVNIEIVDNYLSFLPVTGTVSSDARFDGYELLMTAHGAGLSGQAGHTSEIAGLRT